VGFVRFNEEHSTLKNGKVKDKMVISVTPITEGQDDSLRGATSTTTEESCRTFQKKYSDMQNVMIARRAIIKRNMLNGKAFEPALFFPLKAKGSHISFP
jgi:hypothetical protein